VAELPDGDRQAKHEGLVLPGVPVAFVGVVLEDNV